MRKRVRSLFAVMVLMLLITSTFPAYAADGETISVEVPAEVILEGPILDSKDTFTIELAAVTSGAPMPEGAADGVYTDTIEGEGSLTFTIEYSHTGVYSYTVSQIPGDNPDCTYDDTVYSLTVYVTVDEEWNMEVTTVMEDEEGEKLATATFINVYDPPKPAKLDPPVKKIIKVKNGTPPQNPVFTFAMIPSEKDAPMPEPGEATLDEKTGALYKDIVGEGEYEFGWMYFDEDDIGKTYTYTLKEIPGDTKGFTYDSTNYTMTVVVSVKNREIILDVTYTDDSGSEVDMAVFTNVYDKKDPVGPPTGDTLMPFLWVALAVVSLAAILVLVFIKKRQNKA